MRKLALKPENVEIVENSDTPTSAPETAPALTPEMIQLVQRALMAPGGIKALLKHEKVASMRDDADMKPFFRDIEQGGLFAAMKYISNKTVMSKLAEVAKEIL